MLSFHHQPLPAYSALLMGHTPPDTVGCMSERLQIWYNQTEEQEGLTDRTSYSTLARPMDCWSDSPPNTAGWSPRGY
jgi:hypothetical protein